MNLLERVRSVFAEPVDLKLPPIPPEGPDDARARGALTGVRIVCIFCNHPRGLNYSPHHKTDCERYLPLGDTVAILKELESYNRWDGCPLCEVRHEPIEGPMEPHHEEGCRLVTIIHRLQEILSRDRA